MKPPARHIVAIGGGVLPVDDSDPALERYVLGLARRPNPAICLLPTATGDAERVIVRGRTSGVIRAMTVALQASARVEGDIHHMSLAIEQGAEFDGRCRRPASPAELQVDLDGNG